MPPDQTAELAAVAAEIEGGRKIPLDVVEAVGQPFRHFADQEVVFGEPGRGPVAMAPDGPPVEDPNAIRAHAAIPRRAARRRALVLRRIRA